MLIGRLFVVVVLFLGGVVGDVITTTTTPEPLRVSGYATASQVWPKDRFSVVLTVWTNTPYLAAVTINPMWPRPDGFSWYISSASTGSAEGDGWSGGVGAGLPAVVTYTVDVAPDAVAGGRDVALVFNVSYATDTEPQQVYGELVEIPVRVGLAQAPDPVGVHRVWLPVIRR